MREQLVIDGGLRIRLDGEPRQGTRHRVLTGMLPERNQRVVVKVETIPGALERERAALALLGEAQVKIAPQLIAFGEATLGGERVTCLVTEQLVGSPPTTVDGWSRMGGAVARLADIPQPRHSLPVLDPDEFVREHQTRIVNLGRQLDPFVRDVPDWAELTHATLSASTRLVLTHGDPGPGNYLDAGSSGSLIDWEEALIAPLGLDLGRLVFIALLGSGPSGYVARDHRARAAAAADGYLSRAQGWVPTADELRWWLSVAGIQFIHRRWQLGGRPAPWEDSAGVLASALSTRVGERR